jgi:hypothetical protein
LLLRVKRLFRKQAAKGCQRDADADDHDQPARAGPAPVVIPIFARQFVKQSHDYSPSFTQLRNGKRAYNLIETQMIP